MFLLCCMCVQVLNRTQTQHTHTSTSLHETLVVLLLVFLLCCMCVQVLNCTQTQHTRTHTTTNVHETCDTAKPTQTQPPTVLWVGGGVCCVSGRCVGRMCGVRVCLCGCHVIQLINVVVQRELHRAVELLPFYGLFVFVCFVFFCVCVGMCSCLCSWWPFCMCVSCFNQPSNQPSKKTTYRASNPQQASMQTNQPNQPTNQPTKQPPHEQKHFKKQTTKKKTKNEHTRKDKKNIF